jgi:hypothetical protein
MTEWLQITVFLIFHITVNINTDDRSSQFLQNAGTCLLISSCPPVAVPVTQIYVVLYIGDFRANLLRNSKLG